MINLVDLAQSLTRLAMCKPTADHARLTLKLLDLTRLNNIDDTAAITALCEQALQLPETIAAICIYPQFLPLAQTALGTNTKIRLATVVNFPQGNQELAITISQIQNAIAQGAHEIDLVFPYQDYLAGNTKTAIDYVIQCKNASGNCCLKVILETGAFDNLEQLYQASCDVIAAGANFVKTSTGKIETGATLDAAYVLLTAIKDMHAQGFDAGLKVSGGVKTLRQAVQYITLAQQLLGEEWVNANHLRIGASTIPD